MGKLLIVVDMQNDFIDGALGTPEAIEIVPKVIRRITEHEGVVIYTRDTHGENYMDTQEGKNLPVPHCIGGTKGWEVREDVAQAGVRHETLMLDKPSFGSLELAQKVCELYEQGKADEIILIGLCTDICVISNAMILKAALPEVKISVDGTCCAGVTPQSHENALAAMRTCQIVC